MMGCSNSRSEEYTMHRSRRGKRRGHASSSSSNSSGRTGRHGRRQSLHRHAGSSSSHARRSSSHHKHHRHSKRRSAACICCCCHTKPFTSRQSAACIPCFDGQNKCIALGWMLDAIAGGTIGPASPQMLGLQGGLCPKQTLLQLHHQSTRHQLACVQG